MPLIACGVNHHTAPLPLRERLVFAPDHFPHSLQDLVSVARVQEAAILSTCNRTEVYCHADSADNIIDWLVQWHKLPREMVAPHLYIHQEDAVVKHIMRVASGLDSMILGEPQIFGQVKQAFSQAQAAGTVGKQLNPLFQYAFSVTKKVRSQTAIGWQPVTLNYAIVDLAKKIFADLHDVSVLCVGAGEMIDLVARYMHSSAVKNLTIANRTLVHAQQLAAVCGGKAVDLASLPHHLAEADIIISAVYTDQPLITVPAIERAIKARKHKPMLLIDLAMPRSIAPELAKTADVYLYTLENLQNLLNVNLQQREQAAIIAEQFIQTSSQQYMRLLQARKAQHVLQAYRQKIHELANQELKIAQQALSSGLDAQQILEQTTQAIIKKILHQPTRQLQEAALSGDMELLAAAKILFDL